jgi:GNAT superfamily N-acetyltransferase
VEELTQLLNRAYSGLGALGFNYTGVDQSVTATRERIRGNECYLGLIAGRMSATLLLGRPGPDQLACEWYAQSGVWIIGRFAVDPALQRQGIGGQMLAFAEKRAASLGACEVALDTAEGAAHLVDLYSKRGYRPVGQVQWGGKNYRSVVLSKALTTDSR